MSDKDNNEQNPYGGNYSASFGGQSYDQTQQAQQVHQGEMRANVNFGQAALESDEAMMPSAVQLPDLRPKALAPSEIRNIGTAEFMSEVIEASKSYPVVVDFWAPWCGPCKELGPALEKVLADFSGQVAIVKMNIDEHPEVAGQLGVQSIPAVIGFVQGQPADAFMGNVPEAQIKAFLEKMLKTAGGGQGQAENPLQDALTKAQSFLEEGDSHQALAFYSAILDQLPDNVEALAGIGNCLLALGEREALEEHIADVKDEARASAEFRALISKIELADQAEDLGDLAGLKTLIEGEPDNHQARYDYAIALNAAGKMEEAAEELLAIVSKDREWNEDGARLQLLKFFESWGPTHAATIKGRRGLSSVLFR